MSSFDVNNFIDATIDAPMVKRPPIPVGDYIGMVGEPTSRQWVSQKDPSKSGIAVDYMIDVEVPPDVREQLGLDSPTIKVKHGIMVDTLPNGGIDTAPGKNGALRRWREALDLNKPGDKFNFRMAQGRVVKVKVGHREYPEGSGELFEEVLGVARV